MRVCHRCGTEIAALAAVARTDGCPKCHSDLKVCLNCRFFDPGMNNQCREPQAEWQSDKTTGNFCEFFEFRSTSAIGLPGRAGQSEQKSARDAFDALFRKK